MRKRYLLKDQLIEAWTSCIKEDYPKGVINGERALQACLYHHLSSLFGREGIADRRQIFIEPTIYTQGHSWRRAPDMVICDTRKIIAIIELKFHPRTPLTKGSSTTLSDGIIKDLDTLSNIAKNLNDILEEAGTTTVPIQFKNERYLGINQACKSYRLADNLMLVWAGAYKQSDDNDEPPLQQIIQPPADASVKVPGGFLQLHAKMKGACSPAVGFDYGSKQILRA